MIFEKVFWRRVFEYFRRMYWFGVRVGGVIFYRDLIFG